MNTERGENRVHFSDRGLLAGEQRSTFPLASLEENVTAPVEAWKSGRVITFGSADLETVQKRTALEAWEYSGASRAVHL